MWSTLSLFEIPGTFSPGVVVPVEVPSMDQIDLFENYLYLIRLHAKKRKPLLKHFSKYEQTMNSIL